MFFAAINILVLIGLIKLLKMEKNPLMVAGIYTGIILFFNLLAVFTGDLTLYDLLIFSGIRFILAFGYFWLLNKTDSGPLWWIIAVVGIVIGLV